MNFSPRRETETQFQIAPMLDIVFLLLIYFVATSVAAQEEKTLDIRLPAAEGGDAERRSVNEIVVNLNGRGEIFVNRRRFLPIELENRLAKLSRFATEASAEPGVIIRADGDCPHRFVVEVMDLCRKASIRRVFFSATPKGESVSSETSAP